MTERLHFHFSHLHPFKKSSRAHIQAIALPTQATGILWGKKINAFAYMSNEWNHMPFFFFFLLRILFLWFIQL